jgi:hypothetical protein
MPNITYTLSLTVIRPIVEDDAEPGSTWTEQWMKSPKASRELEREVLHCLRRLDGDCDIEVMTAETTEED